MKNARQQKVTGQSTRNEEVIQLTVKTLSANEPIRIGDAVFLGQFESNTPEWHQLRSGNRIGGSDVSTICGVNPWESPFTWWAKKTKRIEDNFEPNEAMEWGSRLESVILDKFADNHPELVITPSPGTFHHNERDWQIANPDAFAHDPETSEDIIIEIKTARYEDDWLAGVPAYYKTQVQWYLQTFGYRRAYVAVLFSGSRYREFEILADDFEQGVNLGKVVMFREKYLLVNKQPDFDGALSTYETVRKLHPDIESSSEVELGSLGVEYMESLKAYQEAEAELNQSKSSVIAAMGKARRGLIDGNHVFTRQAKSGGAPYLTIKKG
jgi:putative phage-type endonuclease